MGDQFLHNSVSQVFSHPGQVWHTCTVQTITAY